MRLKGTDLSRLEVAANVATERPLLEQQTSEPGTRAGCFIHYVERVLTWFNKSQRFMPEMAVVKVNLGSGLHVAPGWINVDGSLKTALAGWPRWALRFIYPLLSNPTHSRENFISLVRSNVFIIHDLKYGVPLLANAADFCFASHLIHHLYKDDARRLLLDIRRVLKPGGIVRIAVPDLEFIVGLYLQGQREEAIERYFFYPSASRNELCTRHYQYDFVLLIQLLESAGFVNVRRCECRQGKTPDIEMLDRLPKETLFVEAEKQL
jgi:predicted SAM-dependent methyltransferase